MATNSRGPLVSGSISANTVAWLAVLTGLGLLGWKYLSMESERNKAAKALALSLQEEAEEARQYVANKNYTDEGLKIREKSLNDKAIALQQMSQSWFTQAANGVSRIFHEAGMTFIIVAGVAMGSLIIWWLVKHYPPNQRPPRCPIDGYQAIDKADLQNHNATHHQPNPSSVIVHNAQLMFLQQPTYIQAAAASEFVYGSKIVSNDWASNAGWLPQIATALEMVMATGLAAGMSQIPVMILVGL
jgi:hypothetical protein